MTEGSTPATPESLDKRDYSTPIPFAAVVVTGGSIGVAVWTSNIELPPSLGRWYQGSTGSVGLLAGCRPQAN